MSACEQCGKDRGRGKRYCSHACAATARTLDRSGDTRACEHCGATYARGPKETPARWKVRKYCGLPCAKLANDSLVRMNLGFVGRVARFSTRKDWKRTASRVRQAFKPALTASRNVPVPAVFTVSVAKRRTRRAPLRTAGKGPVEQRIARLIYKEDKLPGCWIWLGGLSSRGYPRFGAVDCAHRRLYEMFHGPIPAGMTLDHECCRIDCVNPDHLVPVSRGENVRLAFERRRQGATILTPRETPDGWVLPW